MRCLKAVPRRKTGHSAFLMSALVLSSPTVPLSSFHFLSAVLAELPLLWNILWMPNSSSLDSRSSEWKRGTQAAVPRFCRLLRNESLLSGTAQAFFPLLSGQSHSFFPQLKQNSENLRTVSTNKQLWLITCSAWHGQVWSGQLVWTKNSTVFHGSGKNRDLVTSGLNLPKCP